MIQKKYMSKVSMYDMLYILYLYILCIYVIDKTNIYSYLGAIGDLRSFFIAMNFPLVEQRKFKEDQNVVEYLKIYYKTFSLCSKNNRK